MSPNQFAFHSLAHPVQTLEQARAVMKSLEAWGVLGSRPITSDWERNRVAVLPGTAELLAKGANLRQVAEVRQMEAIAFCIEDEKRRWMDSPELGLAELSSLVGFKVSYFNNGPDDPATMGMSNPVFSSAGSAEQSELRSKAFDRLRVFWSKDAPQSPLCGILRLLANRTPAVWEADITSRQTTLESLMGAQDYAAHLQSLFDDRLPEPQASRGFRNRM